MSDSSALGALLFFVLVFAVLGVTIWLVVREFRRIHNHIDVTEESLQIVDDSLRSGLSNLNKNVQTNYLLRGDFATASNNMLGYMHSVDRKHTASTTSLTASNVDMDSRWNKFFSSGNSNVSVFTADNVVAASNLNSKGNIVSSAMFIGDDLKTTINRDDGAVTMSNLSTTGKYDLKVPRMQVGQSLNVAGKLNFATTNSSYMLGVDGTSMYLKMADEQTAKFQLLAPNNTSILTVNRDATTALSGDVSLTGCIKKPGPGVTPSVCLNADNSLTLSGTRVQIPKSSELRIGSYTLKENALGKLVVKKNNADVMVINPTSGSNNMTIRNLTQGGKHSQITAGSSNVTLVF